MTGERRRLNLLFLLKYFRFFSSFLILLYRLKYFHEKTIPMPAKRAANSPRTAKSVVSVATFIGKIKSCLEASVAYDIGLIFAIVCSQSGSSVNWDFSVVIQ